jgi:SAM-dependent methyltransferase
MMSSSAAIASRAPNLHLASAKSREPAGVTLRRPDLIGILACPSCRGLLDGSLRCDGCGAEHDVVEGRPVLLTSGSGVPAKANEVLAAQARSRKGVVRSGLRGAIDRVREATTADLFGDDRTQVPLLVERVAPRLGSSARVLEVGAGEQYYRRDLEALGSIVAMDISLYGATDVIGDCHRLPFAASAFDAVCAVEVLEHLARPWTFFEEAARVLRPGGVLFGVVPQYCPTHGFPHDFFRYTRGGLGSLAEHAGMRLVDAWPIGGRWGVLLHWYWANFAREHPLRRVKGANVAYHVAFQGLARALDRLDARSRYGEVTRAQEHNDHVGWSFVVAKPDR